MKGEGHGKKLVNYWRLTQEAIDNGKVQSTTRYRKPNPKKVVSLQHPAFARQGAGQKGGKASSARITRARQSHVEQHQARVFPTVLHHQQQPSYQPQPPRDHPYFPSAGIMAPYSMPHTMATMSNITAGAFPEVGGNEAVIGCTSSSTSDNRPFCDTTEPIPECAASAIGEMDWY